MTLHSRRDELIRLLRTPIPEPRPSKLKGRWCRSVYIAANGSGWHVTYSGSLPRYRPFQSHDILPLVDEGLLVSTFPGRPGADQSYDLADAPSPSANHSPGGSR